ncbi:hypothetical protein ANO14919_087720 [Xylariales sp. No.14919]|nr:hypothetical protein ANO14919_087720 [Xylariales sp. No.14919]
MSNVIIDDQGTMVCRRRKLEPAGDSLYNVMGRSAAPLDPTNFPSQTSSPVSSREAGVATSQTYAMDGGTFVVMSTCFMSAAGAKLRRINLERSCLTVLGGVCSAIFGPDGRVLSVPFGADKEGIV